MACAEEDINQGGGFCHERGHGQFDRATFWSRCISGHDHARLLTQISDVFLVDIFDVFSSIGGTVESGYTSPSALMTLRPLSKREKTSESVLPLDDILIQTALCFEIGFGVARDQYQSYNLVKRWKSNQVELARKRKHLCEDGVKIHFSNGICRWRESEGCVQYIDPISTCGGKTGWERVQSEYRGETTKASQALGREHVLVLLLKDQMTSGYTRFGRWHEAERIAC